MAAANFVQCSVIGESDKQPSAAIANFTNGRLKKYDQVKFNFFQSAETNKKSRKRQLVAETERLAYVSKPIQKDSASCGVRYMLGIYDKETKKLKVVPTDIYNLKPHFPGDEEEPEENKEKKSLRDKTDELTLAFGSSKKKKSVQSRKKNAISKESLQKSVGSAVDIAMESFSIEDLETEDPNAGSGPSIIPKHNMGALRLEDAYPIDYIITPHIREALLTPAQEFINSTPEQRDKWKGTAGFPSFIINSLNKLPLNQERRTEKCCVITYLHYLIVLYVMKVRELREKGLHKLPLGIPQVVKELLLKDFTIYHQKENDPAPARTMPGRLRDKLLLNILVLCLTLEDFSMEVEIISGDLQLSVLRVTKMLRGLGCQVASEKKGASTTGDRAEVKAPRKIATLKLPLKFPEKRR